MKEMKWNEQWKFWPDRDAFALVWDIPEIARDITLPHDAMIEVPANPDSPNGGNTGFRDAECYTYVKMLYAPEEYKDKTVMLKFEGVYMNAFVYVNGQLAAKILDEYMQDFRRRNPTLRVFSAHLHMDEATPHLHIDFIPYTTGSKRGLDTRVSLKKALAEIGFKGGTKSETERNQWVAAEKERLAEIMLQHGIEWEKKGTHEKHLSVLDFEKKERAKEVAELEQTIFGGKEELSDILHQQIAAGQETEQIRKEGEAIRQEVLELTVTNHLLKEQTETLTEDKEKLLSENEKLEKQQKKLQQEINKMVQSKEVMERNIHAYDEDVKWQLAEPGGGIDERKELSG